jgi:triosephosphate isomerase
MNKIIVANWKMNPATVKEAIALAKAAAKTKSPKGSEVILSVSHAYLGPVAAALGIKPGSKPTKGIRLGAQDVFWQEKGAYTGEVSASMLKSMGVSHVILGHSERRRYLNETDEMVAQKVRAALGSGLIVILCIGEGKQEHEKGLEATKKFVRDQLAAALKYVETVEFDTANLVVTYEPVWAISDGGLGSPDNPENAGAVAAYILEMLEFQFHIANPTVIYGGSVDEANAAGFFAQPEISGALVGAASLDAAGFKKVVLASAGASKPVDPMAGIAPKPAKAKSAKRL